MHFTKTLRRHTRALTVAAILVLALAVSVAGASTSAPPKPKPTHGVKGATFTKLVKVVKGDTGHKGDKGDRGAKGEKGDTGATGPAGPIGLTGPAGPTGASGPAGLAGPIGSAGATGANGAKGDTGTAGAPGGPGANGDPGAKGDKGDKGDPGVAPTESYGVADVKVSRGGAAATTWATYSTDLGSPVGDTAGGSFRFTCSTLKAPCTVGLDAYKLGSRTVVMYPRMLIYGTSLAGGSPVECEYADGTDNGGGKQPLTTTPATTTLGIGGSFDCNGGQTALPDTANGGLLPVTSITVPEGYYDVWTTLDFVSS